MLSVGLVGCGSVAEAIHVPAWRALAGQARVACLADPDPERRARLGECLGIHPDRRYADYYAMLDQEQPQVVDVATPHGLHRPVTLAALRRGCKVLCEAPPGTTITELDEMLAADRGGTVAVVHDRLEEGAVQVALAALRRGEIGTPFALRATSLRPAPPTGAGGAWRRDAEVAGAGCLLEEGYHLVYLAHALLGEPPISAYAAVETCHHAASVEDTVFALLRHRGSATSSLQLAWSTAGVVEETLMVFGSAGTLAIVGPSAPAICDADDHWRPLPVPPAPPGAALARCLRSALDAWTAGLAAPVGLRTARPVLAVIALAYKSAITGAVQHCGP